MTPKFQSLNRALELGGHKYHLEEKSMENPECLFILEFNSLPITRRQILDSSKLKEFADNNFKFDENGRKLSKWVENTVGKGEIARNCLLRAISPFPTVFSIGLFPRGVKRCHCMGMD